MRLVISDAAKADLTEIFEYLAPKNEDAALKIIDDLHHFWSHQLIKHPFIGRAFRDDIRISYIRSYRIYHRVSTEQIDILRIIHTSRHEYEV